MGRPEDDLDQADSYLYDLLARNAVPDTAPTVALSVLSPVIQKWAGRYLLSLTPSGSFAKGTANRSGTDVDLFASVSEDVTNSLQDIYESLFRELASAGHSPKRRNVAIQVRLSSAYDVDVVPARRQNALSQDHSLWRNRARTWSKTNVATHIAYVRHSGRQDECRVMKLWRDRKGLEWPSFYAELTTINALSGARGTLSANVLRTLRFLADEFASAQVIDPANTNNVVSDDLTAAEKATIRDAARGALKASTWGGIL